MARTPILARRCYMMPVHRYRMDVMRMLDCCVVDTDLGLMVEPRQLGILGTTEKIQNWDPIEAGFDSMTLMDDGAFYNQYGSYITQIPIDFSL